VFGAGACAVFGVGLEASLQLQFLGVVLSLLVATSHVWQPFSGAEGR